MPPLPTKDAVDNMEADAEVSLLTEAKPSAPSALALAPISGVREVSDVEISGTGSGGGVVEPPIDLALVPTRKPLFLTPKITGGHSTAQKVAINAIVDAINGEIRPLRIEAPPKTAVDAFGYSGRKLHNGPVWRLVFPWLA